MCYNQKLVVKLFGIVSLGARIKATVFCVFTVRGTARQVYNGKVITAIFCYVNVVHSRSKGI